MVGDWYCRHRARSVSNMVTYNLTLCYVLCLEPGVVGVEGVFSPESVYAV